MPITIHECQEITSKFQRDHIRSLTAARILGIHLLLEDDNLILVVYPKQMSESVNGLPSEFTYQSQSLNLRLAVVSRPAPRFRFTCDTKEGVSTSESISGIYAGNAVSPVLGHLSGTAGWFIELDGNIVCITNWHVACRLGNATPLGDPQQFMDDRGNWFQIGFLSNFQRVETGAGNIWDFAEILINPADADRLPYKMKICPSGTRHSYPEMLTSPTDVTLGTPCRKISDVSGCSDMTLNGFIPRATVEMDNTGLTYLFVNQLTFSGKGVDGDSGSIISRSEDNSALGLHFASNADGTLHLSNPLYLAPWNLIGLRRLSNGLMVPMFVTKQQSMPESLEWFSEFDGRPTFRSGYTILGWTRSTSSSITVSDPDVIATARLGPNYFQDSLGAWHTQYCFLLLGSRRNPNGKLIKGILIRGTPPQRIGNPEGSDRLDVKWFVGPRGWGYPDNSGEFTIFLTDSNEGEGFGCYGNGWRVPGGGSYRPPNPRTGVLNSIKVGEDSHPSFPNPRTILYDLWFGP